MNRSATPRASASFLSRLLSFVSDLRFLQVVGQIVFVILVIFVISNIVNEILSALSSRNLTPNFTFLENRAGFEIAGAGDYSANDNYWKAFQVGIRNTIQVVIAGLVGATVLGVIWGIMLLSTNWLIRTITRVIVEILRNTPLLVQIFVAYFVVVLSLPALRDSLQFPAEGVYTLPLRWLGYLIILLVAWRWARTAVGGFSLRRSAPLLVISAAVRLELGFNQPITLGFNLETLLLTDILLPYLFGLAAVILLILLAVRDGDTLRGAVSALILGQVAGALLSALAFIPTSGLRYELTPFIYLSNRGLFYPLVQPTARFGEWILFVVLGVVVAVAQWVYLRRIQLQTGEPQPVLRNALLAIIGLTVIGWVIAASEPVPSQVMVTQNGAAALLPLEQARAQGLLSASDELLYTTAPLAVSVPHPAGLRFVGGLTLSQGYIALLLALVVYTAAFIAEIVRAGILAVPTGQIEAARALGLTYRQMLSMVVLPQALRVIIPPLGNQYLNLSKNSSLGIAIAYSDIYGVMYTVINQSGQSVTGIILIMVSYLILSLIIATVVNWVNRRFQIVAR